jgi:hypothetical protein
MRNCVIQGDRIMATTQSSASSATQKPLPRSSSSDPKIKTQTAQQEAAKKSQAKTPLPVRPKPPENSGPPALASKETEKKVTPAKSSANESSSQAIVLPKNKTQPKPDLQPPASNSSSTTGSASSNNEHLRGQKPLRSTDAAQRLTTPPAVAVALKPEGTPSSQSDSDTTSFGKISELKKKSEEANSKLFKPNSVQFIQTAKQAVASQLIKPHTDSRMPIVNPKDPLPHQLGTRAAQGLTVFNNTVGAHTNGFIQSANKAALNLTFGLPQLGATLVDKSVEGFGKTYTPNGWRATGAELTLNAARLEQGVKSLQKDPMGTLQNTSTSAAQSLKDVGRALIDPTVQKWNSDKGSQLANRTEAAGDVLFTALGLAQGAKNAMSLLPKSVKASAAVEGALLYKGSSTGTQGAAAGAASQSAASNANSAQLLKDLQAGKMSTKQASDSLVEVVRQIQVNKQLGIDNKELVRMGGNLEMYVAGKGTLPSVPPTKAASPSEIPLTAPRSTARISEGANSVRPFRDRAETLVTAGGPAPKTAETTANIPAPAPVSSSGTSLVSNNSINGTPAPPPAAAAGSAPQQVTITASQSQNPGSDSNSNSTNPPNSATGGVNGGNEPSASNSEVSAASINGGGSSHPSQQNPQSASTPAPGTPRSLAKNEPTGSQARSTPEQTQLVELKDATVEELSRTVGSLSPQHANELRVAPGALDIRKKLLNKTTELVLLDTKTAAAELQAPRKAYLNLSEPIKPPSSSDALVQAPQAPVRSAVSNPSQLLQTPSSGKTLIYPTSRTENSLRIEQGLVTPNGRPLSANQPIIDVPPTAPRSNDPQAYASAGDFHGHPDLQAAFYRAAIEAANKDNANRLRVVQHGDLINKGPKSMEVVQNAMDMERLAKMGKGLEMVHLGGNHEIDYFQRVAKLLDPNVKIDQDFMEGASDVLKQIKGKSGKGVDLTLKSMYERYGIKSSVNIHEPPDHKTDPGKAEEYYQKIREDLKKLPKEPLDFISSRPLEDKYIDPSGNFPPIWATHAGTDPSQPLADIKTPLGISQRIWARLPEIYASNPDLVARSTKWVKSHGHTMMDNIVVRGVPNSNLVEKYNPYDIDTISEDLASFRTARTGGFYKSPTGKASVMEMIRTPWGVETTMRPLDEAIREGSVKTAYKKWNIIDNR